ncbi:MULTISPECIES: helicase-exonuclease AddAB subunit AddB [Bhargavaea]|uniref:ATP-dependent helicase/deoxyribonuclease subunit B n=1 Tax=Bhargavaea changchunensis TaxID=2134037 RepID=A0ABW2NG70_9BACL|nr:helicase-exonuclease AddAB subunit AddB [Bhargavaea sp. CC-171006]
MSFRLITGRAGSGKTTMVRKEIAGKLKESPIGSPIFVVVPDQMSFSMEKSLSTEFGLRGTIRAQVATFKRLAWRILQETGGITRTEVNGFGYRMLIRSLLAENRDEFKLFRQAADKRGFTEQLEDLLKEFSRYCLDCTTMTDMHGELEQAGAPRALLDKADDLELLMSKIEERLGTAYVDSEGYLALLSSQIRHSDLVKDAEVYVDGFVTFTTRELEIVEELMKHARRVTVVLPMEDPYGAPAGSQLFFNAQGSAARLMDAAKRNGVETEEGIHLGMPRRFKSRALAHLETVFDQYPAPTASAEGDVELIRAADARAEVHAMARRIRSLMMSGMRYRDMAILYRQPEVYDELIETVFPLYDVPVFISRKKPMLHHPLIEFSRSVLEAVAEGWEYEDIFRAVKTDLFFPHGADPSEWRDRADRLENFVLANGIRGERWFDEKRWQVKRYRGLEFHRNVQTDEELAMQEDIRLIRDAVREPLANLEARLRRGRTGRDIAETLFTFMEDLQVFDKIVDLRRREEEAGRLFEAAEHDQAWNSWIEVLDQFVLMFGDQERPLVELIRILDEGFDTLEFARIPPSIDQVTVTTVDISRLMDMEAVFIIGVNDGVFPKRIDQEGLLSDREREWFMEIGLELAPTTKMRLMDEMYMAYRAFTTASSKLYLSYPASDAEGKALIPSLYLKRIRQILPDVAESDVLNDPAGLPEEESWQEYISHPRATLRYASAQMRLTESERELSGPWRTAIDYYRNDPYWSMIFGKVFRPSRKRDTERLEPAVTSALYGEEIGSSVSRVESYFSCPFQHYASFGLKLRERGEFTLDPPALGDLFHAALKWISDETGQRNLSWGALSQTECLTLARDAVESISPYFFNQILLSSNRYAYIKRKITRIIQRTLLGLSRQAKHSGFNPVAIEAAFGPGEKFPPLRIPLKRGRTMQLRGRIDRVDAAEVDGKPFIRVVDYKSSARALDLAEVYYGLSLQMLTYLDVALLNSDEWFGREALPAGVLYMHVHNPMIRAESGVMDDAEIEAEAMKSYRMRGYVLDNPDVVLEMDKSLDGSSDLLPVRMNKNGTFSKTSKVIGPESLSLMREYVRHKYRQAGDSMIDGDTRVLPYRMKDKMPCQTCAYRSVCQFDPADPAQRYQALRQLTPEESINMMEKEVQRDEDTGETR